MGAILPPGTLPGGGVGGGELNFLYLLHMRNTNTDFQLPTSKTDLAYNCSEMGAILPPGTLPWGGWGRGVQIPRSTSYEKHTYQFSASYLQD